MMISKTRALLILSFLSFGLHALADDGINNLTNPDPAICDVRSDIIPTCLIGRTLPVTPEDMLTNDGKICECMMNFPGISIAPADEKEKNKNEMTPQERDRLRKNAATKAGNLQIIQASQYATSKEVMDAFALVYTGAEARQRLSQLQGSGEIPGPLASKNLTLMNDIPAENNDWQCVTFQEYSVQREIPNDNDFFAMLRDSGDFNPEEWNVKKLERKYRTASDSEKSIIKHKLVFLSRNPIFDSIMSAVPDAKIKAETIRQRQQELYGIMMKLRPASGSKCFDVPNKCWAEAHTSSAFRDYSLRVRDFLVSNDVIDIASSENARRFMDTTADITRGNLKPFEGLEPRDPEGFFKYAQTAFPDVATACHGSNLAAECYGKFKPYCNGLQGIQRRLLKTKAVSLTGQDLKRSLDEDSAVHASANPTANMDFRKFNDQVCLQEHANQNGEKLNYFQFKSKVCGTNPLPECNDRRKLLGKFLGEYQDGGDPSLTNVLVGFSELIKDASYLKISEVQIAVANNLKESPRELRERFGGFLPTISPTGQLVPSPAAVGVSARTASSSDTSDLPGPIGSGSSTGGATKPIAPVSAGGGGRNALSHPLDKPATSAVSVTNVNPTSGNTIFRPPSSVPLAIAQLGAGGLAEAGESANQLTNNSGRKTKNLTPEALEAQEDKSAVADSLSPLAANSLAKGKENGGGGEGPVGAGGGGVIAEVKKSKPSRERSGAATSGGFAIVNPALNDEVRLSVPDNLFAQIEANPNSFDLSEAQLNKILESPEDEVMMVVESEDGKRNIVLYAKKDEFGAITLSRVPSASRSPASLKGKVRVSVDGGAYTSIKSNSEAYLNKNEALLLELDSKTDWPVLLQVVSPGKAALVFEVVPGKNHKYVFRAKRK